MKTKIYSISRGENLESLGCQSLWKNDFPDTRFLTTMFCRYEMFPCMSCLTVCNPLNYSPPGSSFHGIFQPGILEWVAISYSKSPLYLLTFFLSLSACFSPSSTVFSILCPHTTIYTYTLNKFIDLYNYFQFYYTTIVQF